MPCRQEDAPACRWIAAAAHKSTAANGISFGGNERTTTVANKIRRIKTVEGNAENRADRASSRFQLRQPSADVPTSNGVSRFGLEVAREDQASINRRDRSCRTSGKESGFLLRHRIE